MRNLLLFILYFPLPAFSSQLLQQNDSTFARKAEQVLDRYYRLTVAASNEFPSSPRINKAGIARSLEKFRRKDFIPLLRLLPEYICKTRDSLIAISFLQVMEIDEADIGKADEALGRCYACQPVWLICLVETFSRQSRPLLFFRISLGLGSGENLPDQRARELETMLDSAIQRTL